MALLYILVGLVLLETTFLVFRSFKGSKIGTRTKRKIYVDTSALMDGRILSIARAGFIGDDLIIPRSAIRELQLLADGKDSEKRMRARLGMETANELERIVFCNTEIFEDALDRTPVDERLIQLAKESKGLIFTCDFNLQKVAETEKIEVLNPNELAAGLRSEFVPGDKFKLKISAEGQNPKQGVGYLPEGTMVVVEAASTDIGKEVEVEFEKYIQTNSGRMMFAKKTIAKKAPRKKVLKPTIRKISKPRKDQRQTRSRGRDSRR